MPKPIGNMTANLKNNDKVSSKILARFETKSSLEALAIKPPAPATRQPKKYKTRKK